MKSPLNSLELVDSTCRVCGEIIRDYKFNPDGTKRRTRAVHTGRCQGVADERKLLKTANR